MVNVILDDSLGQFLNGLAMTFPARSRAVCPRHGARPVNTKNVLAGQHLFLEFTPLFLRLSHLRNNVRVISGLERELLRHGRSTGFSSPHFHVFSYASCVDLTQLLAFFNSVDDAGAAGFMFLGCLGCTGRSWKVLGGLESLETLELGGRDQKSPLVSSKVYVEHFR